MMFLYLWLVKYTPQFDTRFQIPLWYPKNLHPNPVRSTKNKKEIPKVCRGGRGVSSINPRPPNQPDQ